MGTPFRDVYEVFLGKIEQDTWDLVRDVQDLEEDWFMLLRSAVNRFMFPRISLEFNEALQSFNEKLGEQEIQVLAVFMRNEWLKRALYTYSLIRQEYSTKDFQLTSQANHMEKLKQLVELSDYECKQMINLYSRVIDKKPLNWSGTFAGGNFNG